MADATTRPIVPGKVDVVIPLFNQEQYIGDAVRSVFAQTYKNYSLMIVNDGSTDCSRRVLQEAIDEYTRYNTIQREKYNEALKDEKYDTAGRREKLWKEAFGEKYPIDTGWQHFEETDLPKRAKYYQEVQNQGIEGDDLKWKLQDTFFPTGERQAPLVIDRENSGLSASRNVGIAMGDGEFILPLDADDWLDPRFLELTVPKMQDPKVGVVATDMQYEGLLHNRIAPRGLTLANEMTSNDLPVCSLIRRQAFEQTKGYETIFIEIAGSTRVLGYEDWEMWISILKHGWAVAVVNEPLFHYRVKPVSMITQATRMHAGLVRLVHLLHPDLWPNG